MLLTLKYINLPLTNGILCVFLSLFLPRGLSVDSTLITPAPSRYLLLSKLITSLTSHEDCYSLAVVTIFSAKKKLGSETHQTFYFKFEVQEDKKGHLKFK